MKSAMLPVGMSADLNATFGRMSNMSRNEEIVHVLEMRRKIRLGVDC